MAENTTVNTGVAGHEEAMKFSGAINNLGRVTSIISLALMLAVPAAITIAYGISIEVGKTLEIAGSLIAMFAPMAIVENISYYPIIGAGGVYLSCITGNIMNMKLPSALSGMKIANVEPGSERGDIISILSIAASSFTTVSILALSIFVIGVFLTPILENPALKPAFSNIMPALLGALVTPFVMKSPKIAATPFVIAIALSLYLGGQFVQRYQSYFLPVIMSLSVLAAYVMYKKGMIGGARNEDKR
jgi:hypothetical protein